MILFDLGENSLEKQVEHEQTHKMPKSSAFKENHSEPSCSSVGNGKNQSKSSSTSTTPQLAQKYLKGLEIEVRYGRSIKRTDLRHSSENC
jgi:hypothetical protein